MNELEFWSVIAMLDWKETGDDEAVVKLAVDYLSTRADSEIFQFEELLTQYLHGLDTQAHAKEIGEYAYVNEDVHFSVDLFLYARCVVVANGKELFDRVLKNPAQFPKDIEFEAILYIAQNAFELKHDNKDWEYFSSLSYETYANSNGWK